MSLLSRKNCWCLEITLLVAIFSFSFVSAENAILNYPSIVNCGENFSVFLRLDNFTGIYDVRIDLFNSTGNRIADILNNGEWKSTYYYINQAINTTITNEAYFSLNVTEIYNGAGTINVTLRSGSKYYKFGPYNLNIIYTNKTIQTNNSENQPEEQKSPETFIELGIDSSIEINKEFDVRFKAYNLKSESYDVKIYVTYRGNESVISEIYDDKNDNWKSGKYFINGIVNSSGNKSITFNLRLDSGHNSFIYESQIKAKLRNSLTGEIIASYQKDIVFEEAKAEENNSAEDVIYENEDVTNVGQSYNDEVIQLNKKDIKSQNLSQEYKAITQYIKDYSIFGFALVCVLIIIVLIIKKR